MASPIGRYLLAGSARSVNSQSRLLQQFTCKYQIQLMRTKTGSTHRINVGVIGMGRIGELHLANVLANRRMKLNWVVEEKESRAKEVQEKFFLHDVPFHGPKEISRLLNEGSLDGVLILSPIPTHAEYSCQALEKGKAVFVEKPVAQSVEDIRKCFDTADKVKKPFVVGYNRRFDAAFAKVHEEVTKGSVGSLQYIHLTARDSPKPSYEFLENCDTGGCSILTDLAVHDIDHLVWITRVAQPEHIYVTTHGHDQVMAKFGEADALSIVIKFKNGCIATVNSSREAVYGYDIRSEVFGSDGMVTADNPRLSTTVVDQAHGGSVPRLQYSFPQRFRESFEAELNHFCDCVQGKATPSVTKEESLMVAEIVDKGLQSFKTKQPVYF